MGLGGISVWQLIIMLVVFLPAILVLSSSRECGWKKFGWAFVALSLWFAGYVLFLILTKKTSSKGADDVQAVVQKPKTKNQKPKTKNIAAETSNDDYIGWTTRAIGWFIVGIGGFGMFFVFEFIDALDLNYYLWIVIVGSIGNAAWLGLMMLHVRFDIMGDRRKNR